MKFYRLFSKCFPVKGLQSSAIYDVTREKYHCIPNSLFEILRANEIIVFEHLQQQFSDDFEILTEYFEFLLAEDLIFECPEEELQNFPDLDISWDYPAFLTNAVLEVDSLNSKHLSQSLSYLDEVGCRFIQLCWLDFSIDTFNVLLAEIENYRFNSIEMIIDYSELNEDQRELLYAELNDGNRRFRLVIQRSNRTEFKRLNEGKDLLIEIVSSYAELKHDERGSFFKVNLDLYLESQKFNNYLNRKMFIGSSGEIKNVNYSTKSFGTISQIKSIKEFKKIIASESFRVNWLVNKDMIRECSICEYRYMCVDDRELKVFNDGNYGFNEPCVFRQKLDEQIL